MLFAVALSGLTLTACSDEDLDTNQFNKDGVNILAFGPMPITRGETMRVTGTSLDKVKEVLFPEGNQKIVAATTYIKGDFSLKNSEEMTVTIPDQCVPGKLRLVTASNDTIVSASNITFTEEITVTGIEPLSVSAGDIITIKGEYVWNIAEITFTAGVKVLAEEFVLNTRNEIQVRVPLAAQSGTVVLSDGADWTYEYETPLDVHTALVTSVTPNAADFGEEITIKGANLHTVETLMFAGGITTDFTLVDNETIKVTVPAECKSGAITLVLYSGATVSTEEFSVPTVAITNVTPAENLMEGDVITITGVNFDRIKEIRLPGLDNALTEDQYTLDGNTITLTVPEDMVDGDIQLVQNSSITATHKVTKKKMGFAIWTGKVTVSGWGGALEVAPGKDTWEVFKSAMTGPGKMIIHVKKTGADCNLGLSLCNDWESPIPSQPSRFIWLTDANQDLEIDITQEDLDVIIGKGAGFVIWGEGPFTIKCIEYIPKDAPKIIMEGNWSVEDGAQPYVGTDEGDAEKVNPDGNEFKANGVKAGQILRFYVKPTSPNWLLQIFEGHWAKPNGVDALCYGTFGSATCGVDDATVVDLDAEGGCVKLQVTDEMVKYAITPQWWGGIFVIQGADCVLTKITVGNM